MPAKPPTRGITTVSVHKPPPDYSIIRPGFPPLFDGQPSHRILTRPTPTTVPTSVDIGLNRIVSAPARATVSTTAVSESAAVVRERPLKDYWITSLVVLPVAGAEGISTLKGRQYVQVPEGGTVQVELDAASGFYRAKLPSELHPSGPLLQFAAESRLWHPIETWAPADYPLSTTRLEAFRTDLDFSTVEPDGDGLYRFSGKLYVEIENHAYQVLHDPDGSTPHRTVMRIVRPDDPIATDATNVYVASRSGRSEPIVFDARYGWRGTTVTGAAGMPGGKVAPLSWKHLEVKIRLGRFDRRITQDHARSEHLRDVCQSIRNAGGERTERIRSETMALLDRELHSHQALGFLAKAIKFHKKWKPEIRRLVKKEDYINRMIALQKSQMGFYEQLIECGLTRHALGGPLIDVDRLPRTTRVLSRMLGYMRERQLIADNLVKTWRMSPDEFSAYALTPMDTHDVVATWVLTKSLMLDDQQPAGDYPRASELAAGFGQATFVYGALGKIPETSHPAILNDLLQECTAIREWYERLDLAPGEQATSRTEITAELKKFEETLAHRLNQYHQQLEGPLLPVDDQAIDFEYVPAQDRTGVQPPPKRIFKAKKHGIYKINVGESRRTAHNEEVIDVRNLHDPQQPVQTYEQREGEWRPVRTTQDTPLPRLIVRANRNLEQTDAHVRAALREEEQKNHPDNIVEMLERKAGTMDEIALQLLQHAPADGETGALIQRLHDASERLHSEGENIRIRIYKDRHFLSPARLLYLIDKGEVSAQKIETRLKRGKGQKRDFIDIYLLTDAHTHDHLWHAHFHYAKPDTPDLNFNTRGAHLKTLEQSSLGVRSQQREELAQRPHVPIWREPLNGRTAQKIFDLAAASAHPHDTASGNDAEQAGSFR
ncbi:hypothetical protein GXB78_00565 [Pseudomonas moraviensis subsp. stanleyae]|uniref:hypothetical protein n=1 Tax=Pseudomonas moraviensis TaxID=321662 RepID=UPI002E340311|nr:hypothetical protein [Pseudomonas moraviensis]MED7665701.1 hypothetical protein [Pseudomonas moraviensis subsp. stanleyae]